MGVLLTWKDVSVKVGNRSRHLLDAVSGFAEPGSLLAIMGSSGCGKTTLLNALSGRLCNAILEKGSQILTNGLKQQLSYGNSAYVTQDESLITTLTVHETLMYSAHLQLPKTMTASEKQERVHKSIQEMGLQHCIHTRVGGWHVRGLSGGEKRRLSIAIETLREPSLFFVDEPTSGLDSVAAFHVVKRLKALAKSGKTVITSIHQPSNETFALFDMLCLLANGRTIYFGETNGAYKFYEDVGFPCPPLRSPPDHFLWIINSNFEEVNDQDIQNNVDIASINVEKLTNAYKESKQHELVMRRIRDTSTMTGNKLKSSIRGTHFLSKTYHLTSRTFTNMNRDLTYYWFRLCTYIVLSIAVGTIYYKVGLSYASIQARASMLMFVSAFLSFLAVLSFPAFIEDMKIFTRERLNGHYGVSSFVIANTLSSFPFLVLIAIIPGSIIYFLAGLHPGISQFCYFIITLIACLSTVEGLLMAVASVVPNFLAGMIVGCGIMGIYLLTGGFFRLLGDMPKPVWQYPFSYISMNTWVNKAFYNNDFVGLQFDLGGSQLEGKDIVENMFQMHISYSKWWLPLILVCMAIVYRVFFFFGVKLRERR